MIIFLLCQSKVKHTIKVGLRNAINAISMYQINCIGLMVNWFAIIAIGALTMINKVRTFNSTNKLDPSKSNSDLGISCDQEIHGIYINCPESELTEAFISVHSMVPSAVIHYNLFGIFTIYNNATDMKSIGYIRITDKLNIETEK